MLEKHAGQIAKSKSEPQIHDLDAQAPVACARCERACRGIWVNHAVRIDRCEGCGFIWIDRDEWSGVISYVRRNVGSQPIPWRIEELLHDREALRREVVRVAGTGEAIPDSEVMTGAVILAILASIFG